MIAAARRYYNLVVRRFRTLLESFPQNQVARIGNFIAPPFYRLEDDAEREPAAVDLSPAPRGGEGS